MVPGWILSVPRLSSRRTLTFSAFPAMALRATALNFSSPTSLMKAFVSSRLRRPSLSLSRAEKSNSLDLDVAAYWSNRPLLKLRRCDESGVVDSSRRAGENNRLSIFFDTVRQHYGHIPAEETYLASCQLGGCRRLCDRGDGPLTYRVSHINIHAFFGSSWRPQCFPWACKDQL